MEEKGKYASSATLISRHAIEVSTLQRILWLLNTLYYQIIAALTFVMFWIFFDSYQITALRLWHLVFSTAAFMPLMAVAIILFSENNITTLHIPRTKRYRIHGALLGISCLAITVGISVETHRKRGTTNPTHFQSDHAILGLVAWILVFVSILIGLIASNTRTFSIYIKPIVAKLIHNFLGLTAFAIGIGSLFEKLNFFNTRASAAVNDAIYFGLIYVVVWSGLAALKSLYEQIKGVFS